MGEAARRPAQMRRIHANLLMLCAALIWGVTFSIQQLAMEHIPPSWFTGIRFVLGALVVLPLALRERHIKSVRESWTLDRGAWPWMVATGGALFLGALFQQYGIEHTTVANAGFLTALYVPLTPIIAFFILRQHPHPTIWAAALACLVGAYMMSGSTLDALNVGDVWVVLGALFWAIHILLVGYITPRTGAPFHVACVQFSVVGGLGLLVGAMVEDITVQAIVNAAPMIAFSGLLSVGMGFTLQVVAQKHTPPADAAVILSAETVFAALAGAIILGESLGVLQWSGGALILSGVLAVELLPLVFRQPRSGPT
ncbi:DMT family transporter [Magnetovibrio sp. PR-2]|uniref:DMT family transporter n=1 Tax=Magnetovibrio sp. PR-2 TaxID=3120356 RepID=UPI002FCDF170